MAKTASKPRRGVQIGEYTHDLFTWPQAQYLEKLSQKLARGWERVAHPYPGVVELRKLTASIRPGESDGEPAPTPAE